MVKVTKKEKDTAGLWGNNIITLADVERRLKTKSPTVYIKLARALKAIHYSNI